MTIEFQPEIPGILAERTLLSDCQYFTLEVFTEDLRLRAGDKWGEVARLFNEYGKFLSIPFYSAVYYAIEQGKLDWCLELLQRHFDEDLSYQHPDLRGRLVIGHVNANRSETYIVSNLISMMRPDLFTKK